MPAQSAVQEPQAQRDSGKRTWSIFTEYSPGSSHIVLGVSREREYVALGAGFTQRFFQNRTFSLAFRAEVRPLMVESDPVMTGQYYNINLPAVGSFPGFQKSGYYRFPHELPVLSTARKSSDSTFIYKGETYFQDYTFTYGRRWTYVGGLSPAGLQAKFLPRSRVQPVLTLMTGFAVSTRDIPVFDSSALNFTFSFGGGFDFLNRPRRAMRFEYRYQHLSNAYLGTAVDPGIDSQVLHVGYSWGR